MIYQVSGLIYTCLTAMSGLIYTCIMHSLHIIYTCTWIYLIDDCIVLSVNVLGKVDVDIVSVEGSLFHRFFLVVKEGMKIN